MIPIVDSAASDTVLLPTVARSLPMLHSSRAGTEYEVANGGVIFNFGEGQAEVVTKLGSKTSFLTMFQVVEVHKHLLAVSRLVEAGHKVHFDKDACYILMSAGGKIPTRCTGGTCEVGFWMCNPGFTRQSGT